MQGIADMLADGLDIAAKQDGHLISIQPDGFLLFTSTFLLSGISFLWRLHPLVSNLQPFHPRLQPLSRRLHLLHQYLHPFLRLVTKLVTRLGIELGTSWGLYRQLYRQFYRHFSILNSSFISTSRSSAIFTNVSIGGWLALVHHLLTVVGAHSNCSDNHLFVLFLSAKTTLILFSILIQMSYTLL